MAEVPALHVWRRPLSAERRAIGEGHGRAVYSDETVAAVRSWAEAERIGWRQLHRRWRERFPAGPRPSPQWVCMVLSYRTRGQRPAAHHQTTRTCAVVMGRLARDAARDAEVDLVEARMARAPLDAAHLHVARGEREAILLVDLAAARAQPDPVAAIAQQLVAALQPQHNNLER